MPLLKQCRKALRSVIAGVKATRKVHSSLTQALLQISPEDAQRLRSALGDVALDALPNMDVDTLLTNAGDIDKRASTAFARILLGNAQWKPATYAAAAAADADDAAANPAAADPWLEHEAFKLVDDDSGSAILFGHWVDQKMLLLLTSPDFRSVVVQWADARKGRPPGAEPQDLMKRARQARKLLKVTGEDEPALLDKPRLAVAAIFGVAAREGEDVSRALQHLHLEPCRQASKVPCTLCDVYASFSLRWKALVATKDSVPLPPGSMFDVRDSRPKAISWCAAPPRPRSTRTTPHAHPRAPQARNRPPRLCSPPRDPAPDPISL